MAILIDQIVVGRGWKEQFNSSIISRPSWQWTDTLTSTHRQNNYTKFSSRKFCLRGNIVYQLIARIYRSSTVPHVCSMHQNSNTCYLYSRLVVADEMARHFCCQKLVAAIKLHHVTTAKRNHVINNTATPILS